MGRVVKLELGGGADCSGRNTKESYCTRPGELTGIIKLVMLWHAIGHSVRFHTPYTNDASTHNVTMMIYSTTNQSFPEITLEPPHSFPQPQTRSLRYPSSQTQSMLSSRRLTQLSTTLSNPYVKNA